MHKSRSGGVVINNFFVWDKMMKTSRFSYLFRLVSFSVVFVFLLYLGFTDFLPFNFQYGTSLERCLYTGQLQARFPSTPGQKCSGYGGINNTSCGPADSDEVGTKESEDVLPGSTSCTRSVLQYPEHRQYARKKLINDLCNNNGTIHFLKERMLDDIPSGLLSNLVVDDRHGIIYCYVPKVACTEWKRIMIFLSESLKVNGVPYKNISDIPTELIHSDSMIYLNSNMSTMKQKLQEYKKFMFVRNPFVRLISAYRDKFLKMNGYFYQLFAAPIMVNYRNISPPVSAQEAYDAGLRPSFPDFIQYILDLPDNPYAFQEHWRHVYHLCHPCQIKYDFVGKMETLEEDANHLLRVLEVDHIVHFPSGTSNMTEESWINTWFSSIPNELKRKLYKIYEADFKLFGYSLPENFY